jgi:hypothetical protein
MKDTHQNVVHWTLLRLSLPRLNVQLDQSPPPPPQLEPDEQLLDDEQLELDEQLDCDEQLLLEPQ